MVDGASEELDLDAIVAETIDCVRVRADGDEWVGPTPPWFGEVVFGGFVIGQAVHAATRSAPPRARIHSLHAYFLRPVVAGPPLRHRVTTVRDGRTFSSRHLDVCQSDKTVLTMTCSFTADSSGYEYELPLDAGVPEPYAISSEAGPGPWEMAPIGPSEERADGTRASTHRAWLRTARPLPDDQHVHAAMVAFMTDMTGTGARPLHLDGDIRGIVSLDHAAWFHRPLRADDWLFFDVQSTVNTGGRGFLRGTMYGRDRRVAVSIAQEQLLTPFESMPEPPPDPGR